MPRPDDVLAQDFDAIIKAFEAEEFGLMQILSNRIMSNMLFFKPIPNYLPGYICKDIATAFERIKIQKGSAFSTSKVTIKPILLELNQAFMAHSPEEQSLYWDIFDRYNKEIRSFTLTDSERDSYKPNFEFTEKAFLWLVNYLDKNRKLLESDKNQFLDGIINEMDRIYRCHSGGKRELRILTTVRALNYLYIYILFSKENGGIEKINSFIDVLKKVNDKAFDITELDTLINNILIEWRHFYIKYTEIMIARPTLERGFELPDKLRDKLTDSITKTLEADMKVK